MRNLIKNYIPLNVYKNLSLSEKIEWKKHIKIRERLTEEEKELLDKKAVNNAVENLAITLGTTIKRLRTLMPDLIYYETLN